MDKELVRYRREAEQTYGMFDRDKLLETIAILCRRNDELRAEVRSLRTGSQSGLKRKVRD